MSKVIGIVGPTAVGKTRMAIMAAERFNGEIVSCDSMQIYKHMNIGSAKPTAEEQEKAIHHLIDLIDPAVDFSVAKYRETAGKCIDNILERLKTPIVCGGTGLYYNSLVYDMDFAHIPEDPAFRRKMETLSEREGSRVLHGHLKDLDQDAAENIHPNNTRKIIRALERIRGGESKLKKFTDTIKSASKYDFVTIGLDMDRGRLYEKINSRVDSIVAGGLADEVKALIKMGITEDNIAMKGIGYKEMAGYLKGGYDLDEAVDMVKKNTRHYAKKQLTWFKRYDNIKWYDLSGYDSFEAAFEDIAKWLEKRI